MNTLKVAYDLMTEEEKFEALFTDPLTEIYNRRAFELTNSDYVAIIDLDSLKWVNDNISHRAGDTLLIAVAIALQETKLKVYRLSGDEFVAQGDNFSDLWKAIKSVQNKLDSISIGIGPNLEFADLQLREDKAAREESGLRSPRGVCPPWMHIRIDGDWSSVKLL